MAPRDTAATIAAGEARTASVVTRAPRESLCVPPDLRSEILSLFVFVETPFRDFRFTRRFGCFFVRALGARDATP
jgi:hypothetical protein